jgi:predicted PurR-regulated permease PerM
MDNQDLQGNKHYIQNNTTGDAAMNDITKALMNLQDKVNNTTATIDNVIKKQSQTVNKTINKTYLGSFKLASTIGLLYLIFMTIIGIIDFISNSSIKLLVDLLPYWGIVIGVSYGGLSVINYIKNKYI